MDKIEEILSIAEDLLDELRKEPTTEEIDGRFFFEVWDEKFVEKVKYLRNEACHDTQWSEEIKGLAENYGLAESHVIYHVTSDFPLFLPQIAITYEPQGVIRVEIPTNRRPVMVIQIFGDDTSPKAIAGAITNHRKYFSPMIDNTLKKTRFQSQGYPFLVRTWTVLCLCQRTEMNQRQAIVAWNQWSKDRGLAYNLEDRRVTRAGVTGSGESLFSREKEELTRRLLFTS
jgi:hypothetical protein